MKNRLYVGDLELAGGQFSFSEKRRISPIRQTYRGTLSFYNAVIPVYVCRHFIKGDYLQCFDCDDSQIEQNIQLLSRACKVSQEVYDSFKMRIILRERILPFFIFIVSLFMLFALKDVFSVHYTITHSVNTLVARVVTLVIIIAALLSYKRHLMSSSLE